MKALKILLVAALLGIPGWAVAAQDVGVNDDHPADVRIIDNVQKVYFHIKPDPSITHIGYAVPYRYSVMLEYRGELSLKTLDSFGPVAHVRILTIPAEQPMRIKVELGGDGNWYTIYVHSPADIAPGS